MLRTGSIFLPALTPEEIEAIGYRCYLSSYKGKFYHEMKELIANLKEFGFEVWILTASPEILYQKFFADELGLSKYQYRWCQVCDKGRKDNR